MINREILYERNLTGSYMKIPISPNAKFDEKIMLKRKLPGLLPVERCFVNGQGQYWYNISGKQSLDTYCKMRSIGIDFIERMIVSICNEIEILEWNLLDLNCLILDPELIFVTNQNGEFIFTIYPDQHTSIAMEFQQLMEYLLTKIDHSDMDAVHAAYGIYEKTLDEAYSIVDIRDIIVSKKEEKKSANIQANDRLDKLGKEYNEYQEYNKNGIVQSSEKTTIIDTIKKYISKEREENCWYIKVIDSIKKYLNEKKSEEKLSNNKNRNYKRSISKEEDLWVSPEIEDFNASSQVAIHNNPTVCLSNYTASARGVLLYEGFDEMENIILSNKSIRLGKGIDADVLIDKETVSNCHAKIESHENEYYIEDLNSTNGTSVNGETLSYKQKRKLEINDIVEIADIRYKFV